MFINQCCGTFIVFQYTICAESVEEDDAVAVGLASAPIVSRSTNSFVEGMTGAFYFTFEFTIGFGTIVQNETIYYECVYISVPYTNERVEAYKILNDFGDVTLMHLDVLMSQDYPNANLLSSPSHFYNCHSYAWYNDNTSTNCYWIDDPENFYSNYIEVSTPAEGDIICYFDSDDNIHSGVVHSVINNSVKVISKWGYWGLYEHDSDDCPYVLTENEMPTEVKYYRYHPFHNLTYRLSDSNSTVHIANCSGCDYSFVENHTYKTFSNGLARCTKCGHTSIGQIIMSDPHELVGK